MRSPENYVARELMPEFATWAEMRRALEVARQAIDAAAVYYALYGQRRMYASDVFA